MLGHVGIALLEFTNIHVHQRLVVALVTVTRLRALELVPVGGALGLCLPLEVADLVAGNLVHVLKVATQIPALRESLLALGAREGTLARVLAEMVAQVAALLEDGPASSVAATEIEFDAHSVGVPHFDGLVPRVRNAVKSFGVDAALAAQFGNFCAFGQLVHQGLGLVLAADLGPRVAEFTLEDIWRLNRDLDFEGGSRIVGMQGLINLRLDQILINRGA